MLQCLRQHLFLSFILTLACLCSGIIPDSLSAATASIQATATVENPVGISSVETSQSANDLYASLNRLELSLDDSMKRQIFLTIMRPAYSSLIINFDSDYSGLTRQVYLRADLFQGTCVSERVNLSDDFVNDLDDLPIGVVTLLVSEN